MTHAPIRTVIIPAAGRGTRLLPATKVTAKELLPVYDKVVVEFAIEEAVGMGAERIVVVISPAKVAIREHLSDTAVSQQANSGPKTGTGCTEIVYVFQDEPAGLGHAVLICKEFTLPGPFAVLLPDDIVMGPNCLVEMAARYTAGHMIAAMSVSSEEASQYGMFRITGLPQDGCMPVAGMVEKPDIGKAPSSFAAVGRYILDPMIFDVLRKTPVGLGGELQLTDAITMSRRAVPLTAFQFSGTRHDCGNHDGLLAAAVARKASVRHSPASQEHPSAVSRSTCAHLSVAT